MTLAPMGYRWRPELRAPWFVLANPSSQHVALQHLGTIGRKCSHLRVEREADLEFYAVHWVLARTGPAVPLTLLPQLLHKFDDGPGNKQRVDARCDSRHLQQVAVDDAPAIEGL